MHEATLYDPEGAVGDAKLCGVGDDCGGEVAGDDGDKWTVKGLNEGSNFGAVLGEMADKGYCLWLKMGEVVCDGLRVVVRDRLHNARGLHSLDQKQAEGAKE
jgi:hypothetical protein